MSKFFTILTTLGEGKLANATALGHDFELSHMALGDGNGTLPIPTREQTDLVNEVHRQILNSVDIHEENENWIVCELVVPETVGGWTIREFALIDTDGDMVAVGNFPETYKPVVEEGSGRTQTIRAILQVSSSASVTLKVDPSIVLATREYVDSRTQPATEDLAGILKTATKEEALDPANIVAAITPSTLHHLLTSTRQFELYNPSRIYTTGETCYTKNEAGELSFWQWYSNVEFLAGKDPLDIVNRHIGWEGSGKPFYWVPYVGGQVGTPFYWIGEDEPEWSIMEINVNLPTAVYWRLARVYPHLVTGDTINTGEIRGEFLRVLDQDRGIDTVEGVRTLNSYQRGSAILANDTNERHILGLEVRVGGGNLTTIRAAAAFDHAPTGTFPNTCGSYILSPNPSTIEPTSMSSWGGGMARPRNVARPMAIII